MSVRSVRRIAGFVLATALLAACAKSSAPAPASNSAETKPGTPAAGTQASAPKVVKIGGITFLTGKFASYGEAVGKGMKLAVKQINSSGGVLGGVQLELDLEDTASDSTQAVALLRKFAGTDDIVGVVGPTGTPDLLAIMPVAAQTQIPVVTLGSQATLPHDAFNQWVVRVNLMESPALLKAVLQEVRKVRPFTNLALLRDRANDYTEAVSKSVREAVSAQTDIKLVADEAYAAGDKEFSAQLDKLMRANPDAIWLAGVTNEVSLILQQARARGYKGLFLGGSGASDPKIAQIARGAATGMIVILPMDLESSRDVVKKFVAGYRAEYGAGEIHPYAAYAYDAVNILVNAINRAKSTDRAQVMKAVGETRDFPAVTGTYSYNGKGDSTSALPFLFEVTDQGTFKPLK